MADPILAGLEQEIRAGAEAGTATDELAKLRDDVGPNGGLGVFGLLVSLAEAPAPSEEIFAEVPRQLGQRLALALTEDEVPIPEGADLAQLISLYREKKGEKGRHTVRRVFENTLYEFYELRDHGLFVEDVGRVLDILRAARPGETEDMKAFFKGLAALSSDTAKFMLGLFPEQIALIYKVAARQAERKEIDDAFDSFGPRPMEKRVFAVLKTLLQKEKRLRLAVTLWARLHGVDLQREVLEKVEKHLAVKDTRDLVAQALATAPARTALRAFAGEPSRARTLETIEGLYG